MRFRLTLHILPLVLVALTACAASPAGKTTEGPTSSTSPARQAPDTADLSRTDEQGAVIVAVTPENLGNRGNTLNFRITMNTHSVNLGMDLTKLVTLQTDTGLNVSPISWNGPSGGHHISGTLLFPSIIEGKPILEGASHLTLVILEVGVPQRTFTWELGS